MSFILEALKKSDGERQRQAGPALFEVRSATPRGSLPSWAIALGVLLLVNIVALGWFVLRSPEGAAPAPASASATNAPAVAPAAAPTAGVSPPSTAPTNARPVLPPREATPTDATHSDATRFEAPAAAGEAENPADYAEALPESSAAIERDFVPGLAQLPASIANQLPPLHLDMHVYATRKTDRFILLNMQRLREGDATRDGVRVEEIMPTGVVLSFRGTRFLLERD